MPFTPPIRDIRFTLEEVVAVDGLKALGRDDEGPGEDEAPGREVFGPGAGALETGGGEAALGLEGRGQDESRGPFDEMTPDVLAAALEEAGRFASETLAPLNRPGDREGARLIDGEVKTPKGFKEAYAAWVEGGWQRVTAPKEHGGMGLPRAVGSAVMEMVQGACSAWGLAPMLTAGAIEALSVHGTEEQKARYLPHLVAGRWSGAMALTEPQAGSDLALLRTKAWKAGDGTYRIRGQKIWITWGEHDCAENIVHLVLARLDGAPEGVKGISLFLAPKFLLDAEGRPGPRNDFRCIGLEHKMGLHASPTCVMSYGDGEGAVAELVGGEHEGLRAMFTMMNAARLAVGVQGVGLADRAYARALAFARERRQGRALSGEHPARIVEHPDVRRMLMTMKAKIEAARAICCLASMAADYARFQESAEDRRLARAREDLLTPIAKAWSTDMANEAVSLAVQVHGGQGYVEESGAPQHLRDARIAAIYEGTNGIQAIDLIGRKLQGDKGAAMIRLVAEMRETAESLRLSSNPLLPQAGERLDAALDALEAATDWMTDEDVLQADRLAGACPYLALAGDVIGGWLLGVGALAGQRLLKEDPEDDYAASKVELARFFAETTLTTVPGRVDAVRAGAGVVMGVKEEML